MTKIRRKVGWAGFPKQVSKFHIVALAHVMLCLGLRWCSASAASASGVRFTVSHMQGPCGCMMLFRGLLCALCLPQGEAGGQKEGEGDGEASDAGERGQSTRIGKGEGGEGLSSAIVKLSMINSYADEAVAAGMSALHASEEGEILNLTASDFNSVSLKVMEKKLEIMRWQMYEQLQAGSEKVLVDLRAKKDGFQAQLPLSPEDLSLPYGGNVSLANPQKSVLFTSLFGLKFFIQPRPDALAADVLVPAWAAKVVSKASECFFNNSCRKRSFLVLRSMDDNGKLQALHQFDYVLLPDDEDTGAEADTERQRINTLKDKCLAGGGCTRFLAEICSSHHRTWKESHRVSLFHSSDLQLVALRPRACMPACTA